jgi:hypothetical protein
VSNWATTWTSAHPKTYWSVLRRKYTKGRRDMKKDLLAFEDVKTFKAWLKALRHHPRIDDINDLPF